jgi:endonuclease/exonuclease/phosphatase family metal-dependent hydrolase
MRLVSWNCFRGECHTRASGLDDLDADLIVLQECSRPVGPGLRSAIWFGADEKQSLAMLAGNGYSLTRLPQHHDVTHSVFPARVDGPNSFNLLGIWAKPDPTYVSSILRGLDAYSSILGSGPTVVMGDFNSHACFDRHGGPTHGSLVEQLEKEFGLVSAYHSVPGRNPAETESPTHFWRWKQENGFHIDYCFVPVSWVPFIRAVTVLDEPVKSRESDHRPLIVDVDPVD